MAGVPGRSGGARPGAGRKKKTSAPKVPPAGVALPDAPAPHDATDKAASPRLDSLEYLLSVVSDVDADPKLRVRAAVAAAQYQHLKRHDGGKKDEQGATARKTAKGKFAPAAPPKLVVNNGR